MTEQAIQQDELTVLKARADQMGIKYHPKIGLEKLRMKVNNAIEGQGIEEEKEEVMEEKPVVKQVIPPQQTYKPKSELQFKREHEQYIRDEAMRLIRIRVNCMNPNKTAYEGEIFTVSNNVVGTVKKFVPYNIEGGWHVPKILYDHLKERKCQVFTTVRGPRGEKIRKGKLIPEFAIEVLPPLTEEERKDLAQRQAMANSID